jgi:hypothetical protein
MPVMPADAKALQDLLERSYRVISRMTDSVREGRELIQSTAVEKLHATDEKLQEVSTATEVAATDLLDGLDHSLELLRQLEEEELKGRPSRLTESLREEIFTLIGHLQFQDIISQQLACASNILREMEGHLGEFFALFEPGPPEKARPRSLHTRATPLAFDPGATTRGVEHRQALVDEVMNTRLLPK